MTRFASSFLFAGLLIVASLTPNPILAQLDDHHAQATLAFEACREHLLHVHSLSFVARINVDEQLRRMEFGCQGDLTYSVALDVPTGQSGALATQYGAFDGDRFQKLNSHDGSLMLTRQRGLLMLHAYRTPFDVIFAWLKALHPGEQFDISHIRSRELWDKALALVTRTRRESNAGSGSWTIITLTALNTGARVEIHFDETNAWFPMRVQSTNAKGEVFLQTEVVAFERIDTQEGPAVIPTHVVEESVNTIIPHRSFVVEPESLRINEPISPEKFSIPHDIAKRIYDLDAQTVYDVSQSAIFEIPEADQRAPRDQESLARNGDTSLTAWLVWANCAVLAILALLVTGRRWFVR